MSDETQPENPIAEAEKSIEDEAPIPSSPQRQLSDVNATHILETMHRISGSHGSYMPFPYSTPTVTMSVVTELIDKKMGALMDMIQKLQPPVATTALSIPPKVIKPPPLVQGRDWLLAKMNDMVLGMRDKPKPFSNLAEDSKHMRIVAQGSSGRNGSSHYSIKMLKSDEPNDVEYATKSNSFPCSHYYVDCLIDVPTARARSERLGTSGYYELTTTLSNVEGFKAKDIIESDKYLASCISGDGELRHAVWEGHESAYSLSVRVFEYVTKKDDARSSKPRRDQGIELLLLTDNGDRGSEAVSLLASDPTYLNFSGPARLVFTPSAITHVQVYKKVVYKCSTIMLGQSRSRIKAGLSTDISTARGDTKELDEVLNVVRDMISGGVKAKDIVNILKGSTGKKNAEVVAYKQNQKKKVEERQSSEEEEDVEEEDVEEDSDEEQQSSEDEDLEVHRKSKPKVIAPPKKGSLQRTMDPPGATKVKAKYPPKRS